MRNKEEAFIQQSTGAEIMVGHVLHQEMLVGTRRTRWHWFRWVYAGWLIAVLCPWVLGFWLAEIADSHRSATVADVSRFSTFYVHFFAAQHFLLLCAIIPVVTAGAITDEKARGTLQYLLTADLLAWELIVGKLIGRAYQALLLALISLPLFCLFGVFAGVTPIKFLGFAVCTLVLLWSLGAASMLFSVWCRSTRDAVLGLYLFLFLSFVVFRMIAETLGRTGSRTLGNSGSVTLGGTADEWINPAMEALNPLMPLGQNWMSMTDAQFVRRLSFFAAVWSILGLLCLLVAVWRLRRAYVRQLEKPVKATKRAWWHWQRRAEVTDSPLQWKERHVDGIAPLALLRRVPTWLGVFLLFVLSVVVYGSILLWFLPGDVTPGDLRRMALDLDWGGLINVARRLDVPHHLFYDQGWMVMLLAALIVGIRCSGTVTQEREKKTWEALLMTPLPTRTILRGKLWGIAGAGVPYLIAYAIPAVVISIIAGPAAFFWTLLWVGVITLAVFYSGAVGIWCSVRSKSSWRSLFATLAFIYVGGLALVSVTAIFSCILGCFFYLFLLVISELLRLSSGFQTAAVRFFQDWRNGMYIAFCVSLAMTFAFLAWRLLINAEKRVSTLERIRHWREDTLDVPPRPKRTRKRRRRN